MFKAAGQLYLLLFVVFTTGFSQQATHAINIASGKTSFCDSLHQIINNSISGFKNFRFNEKKSATGNFNYATNLSSLGFERKYIQISSLAFFKKTKILTGAYYMALSSFDDLNDATAFFALLKNSIRECCSIKDVDSANRPGYTKYQSFLLPQPQTNSEVMIDAGLSEGSVNTVLIRVINSNINNETEAVQAVIKSTPNNNTIIKEPLDWLQLLMRHGKNSFVDISAGKVPQQKYDPTYSATLYFRDFANPRIECITNSIWDDYLTVKTFTDLNSAKTAYDTLVNEFQHCSGNIPKMTADSSDQPTDHRWSFHDSYMDIAGRPYHYTLRCMMEERSINKYVISLLFTKFPGK